MKYFSSYKQIKAPEGFDILDFFEHVKSENAVILQSGLHGQYSIIGLNPLFVMKSPLYEHFLNELEKKSKFFKLDLDLPFTGGAIGYFSYDFGIKLAGIEQTNKEDIKIPEAYFIFPSQIIVFNHEKNILHFIAWSIIKDKTDEKIKILEDLVNHIKAGRICNCVVETGLKPVSTGAIADSDTKTGNEKINIKSNLTKPQYISKLKEIKKLLIEGETYQVNFSQRFETQTEENPFEIYKKLTKINPSPYQIYLETRNFSIISNSPERLFRVNVETGLKPVSTTRIIESRPIKGTTKRGTNPEEDKKLIKQLLDSKKEQAELDMITDLVRNDLGRLCESGTVEVNENRVIETYSHVHHTMSNVKGILKKDINLTDILKSIFPGGSITGCPKIRTIQIINKLEDVDRDIYCGSAGYIDGRGNMDFNIMIRTILAVSDKRLAVGQNKKRNRSPLTAHRYSLYFHSGGGITIDSNDEKEWEETLHKAEAIKRSLI